MGHTPWAQGTRPCTGQGVLGSDGIRVKVGAQKEQRANGSAAASFEQGGERALVAAPRRSVHVPLAVLEWKANSERFFAYDLEHLASLTTLHAGMLGFVVTFDAKKKGVLRAAKVHHGVVHEDWLVVR